MEPIFVLHRGLPREGPGSDACTREALRRLPPLPRNPVVLDLGCGPGRQTLVLARELNSPVVAVDCHPPYLDRLRASARDQGLAHLVEAREADLNTLEVAPGSVDLLWAEGSAYILGFEVAMRSWRRWLAPGGSMAVTECTWLTDEPPDEARAFWNANYPAMGTLAENERRARLAGLDVLDRFILPASAWWDGYYTPLLDRIAELRPLADAELSAILDDTEREIDLFRRYGDAYGYVFYLLRAGPE